MVHHIKHAKHSRIKLDVKKALPLMNAVELIKLTIMLQQWLARHWIIRSVRFMLISHKNSIF